MIPRRAILLALALIATLAATATAAAPAGADTAAPSATTPKASYLQVVNDVMCVVCHEPLGVAQSPEAFQERDYIRQLIAQGKTRKVIENDLVQQYGPAVLARPPAHGVNLLVYIVPPLVLILGITIVAVFVPRWRRRARQTDPSPPPPAAALDAADAQRLNDDLGRFA
ncbi:MAG TPA: cytochrome c-type biogenesis protein CcmH [Solirubrobacteraceae bacterium]|nr:cytochrome c-type biogenesis protein CcmH [Solirubrobacteraceae bacterium]